MIFPITLMVGTTSVFSRMGRDSEITALRASGISLKRTALPMIMVGALLSVVSYFVLDIGQPWGTTA
jgi:lipopolysaccharide export LptBFGC system permease protein LptF